MPEICFVLQRKMSSITLCKEPNLNSQCTESYWCLKSGSVYVYWNPKADDLFCHFLKLFLYKFEIGMNKKVLVFDLECFCLNRILKLFTEIPLLNLSFYVPFWKSEGLLCKRACQCINFGENKLDLIINIFLFTELDLGLYFLFYAQNKVEYTVFSIFLEFFCIFLKIWDSNSNFSQLV